ncbi:uncharacterized protein LOC133889627 [Phragmites australis]|uniref:uncharacterized protein LOC133889627 n=1 Tax=Phragmites australis TaxID=29695 RepID=UPI002D7977CC|nr:uncharacterized protein LOC133889627 [Phragmites australis]
MGAGREEAGDLQDVIYYNGHLGRRRGGARADTRPERRAIVCGLQVVRRSAARGLPHGFGVARLFGLGEVLPRGVPRRVADGREVRGLNKADKEDTQWFRVFRLDIEEPAADDQPDLARWEELVGRELDGRMLFVGRGCSRSFEAAHFRGFAEFMICFLDDHCATEEPAVMGERRYHLTDTGRFSVANDNFETWPPEEGLPPQTSNRAPPICLMRHAPPKFKTREPWPVSSRESSFIAHLMGVTNQVTNHPAAMATTSWADLPANLILRLVPRFPCLADRVHVSCLNRHWRAVLKNDEQVEPRPPPLPPQLPWLLFPSTTEPSFYTTIGGKRYTLARLPPDVRASRFVGSFDGGWLALALSQPPHAHALYNLNSGDCVVLPRVSQEGHPVMVSVATFSAPPSRPPPEAYLICAIIKGTTPCIAFWQYWMGHWLSAGAPVGGTGEELHDVIYYNGGFHVLTSRERVVVYVPELDKDGKLLHANPTFYDIQQRQDYNVDVEGLREGHNRIDRYLVESRGELLMAVRYMFIKEDTKVLRVFRVDVEEPAADGHLARASWGEFSFHLYGRMLFLGHGCSRSFDVAEFHGFKESRIYFFDDRFATTEPVMGEAWYHLTDRGRYSMARVIVEVWPPEDEEDLRLPEASDRAPPIWWLH